MLTSPAGIESTIDECFSRFHLGSTFSSWFDTPPHVVHAFKRRWYNLWIPIWEDPEDPDRDSNNVDEEDFLGNVVIVAFVGLLILVLHVLVVSAVEVNWLQATKVCVFKATAVHTSFPLYDMLTWLPIKKSMFPV